MMQVNWKKVGLITGVINLVMINVALGLVVREVFFTTPMTETAEDVALGEDTCGEVCMAQIERQVALISSKASGTEDREDEPVMMTGAPTSTVIPTRGAGATATTKKVRAVAYVTIPGSGSSKLVTWENISGTEFYFDKSDYPGLTEIYFEANMNLLNGNGKAFVRLYDAAHSIGVDGSEVTSTGQPAGIYTSGKLNFWAGKNLIRVQAKTLTADTAVYNYGRLKIVTEN